MPNFLMDSGAFDADTLTQAFVAAPYQPGMVGNRNLYEPRGIPTTKARVEYREDGLVLVPSSPRGAPGETHTTAKRKMVEFDCAHLLTRSTILAESLQNVRAMGTDALKTVEQERDQHLSEMRGRLGATIEYHWARALAGQVLDADGSVLVDLLAEFGVAQQSHPMALNIAGTNVRRQIVTAKRMSEQVLGASVPKSWVCFASAGFMDALTDHPSVEAALAGWSAAREMRDDVRPDFDYANVQFVEARNYAGVVPVEDGAAYLVPEGIPGLFITRFAPADYADTINQEGQQTYVRAEPLPFNRGVQMEAQMNPVSIVTRPRAVIKLLAE
ncbi:major capsid protein [Ramlibacter alkalitolerans]|uniref:Major capsid protein n=1 Tax=Ramlibacter alkalitolerans TaxID=2039631 RepID=A0ABS1JUN3_9BURK|nr:major capsid protein [Ramlibacter alkalitolerans]MBL0427942.1 major capsid protein [Ramlibacter alkalitolerans]